MSEVKVEAVETGRGAGRKAKITYTLEECVDAYGQNEFTEKIAETAMVEDSVAMPIWEFALLRLARFFFDWFTGLWGFYLVAFTFPRLQPYLLWLLIATLFLTKFVSSRQGWISNALDLRVVDKTGAAIGPFRAVVRSLAFVFTFVLLPVHLLFFASGSRRLLHDYISGTYVLHGEEDLQRTFYPPNSKIPGLLLIALSVYAMSFRWADIDPRLQYSMVQLVSRATGERSELTLKLMEKCYADTWLDVKDLSPEMAADLAAIYSKLEMLQAKYYGLTDARLLQTKQTVGELLARAAESGHEVNE